MEILWFVDMYKKEGGVFILNLVYMGGIGVIVGVLPVGLFFSPYPCLAASPARHCDSLSLGSGGGLNEICYQPH
jgi:hypothetical protein